MILLYNLLSKFLNRLHYVSELLKKGGFKLSELLWMVGVGEGKLENMTYQIWMDCILLVMYTIGILGKSEE